MHIKYSNRFFCKYTPVSELDPIAIIPPIKRLCLDLVKTGNDMLSCGGSYMSASNSDRVMCRQVHVQNVSASNSDRVMCRQVHVHNASASNSDYVLCCQVHVRGWRRASQPVLARES